MKINTKHEGLVALLIAGIGYGSFGVWVTMISRDIASYQQIFFRYILAFLFVSIILVVKKTRLDRMLLSRYSILLAIGFPFGVVFYTLSILSTKIALTTFSFYMGGFLTSLIMGVLLFKEKITTIKAVSLVIAIVGLLVFSNPFSGKLLSLGIFFGLLAGFFDAISNGFRKQLAGKLDRLVIAAIPMVGGMVISTILALYFNQSLFFIHKLSGTSWIAGIIFGVLLVFLNYLLVVGFQHFDLNLGTVVLSSELLFSALFGWLFLNQALQMNEIVGGLLISLAITIPDLNNFVVRLKDKKVNGLTKN